jgi:hypothetical protein
LPGLVRRRRVAARGRDRDKLPATWRGGIPIAGHG